MSFFKKTAVFLFVCIIQLFVQQVQSKVTADNLRCPIVNKNYLKDVEVFLYDDSSIHEFFASLTVVKSIPHNSTGHLKVTKFNPDTNVYDLPTHLEFSRPFCDTVLDVSSFFWFTMYTILFDDCPPSPGTYSIERFVLIDDDHDQYFTRQLTPHKYMVLFYVTHGRETILYCNVHYDIS